ncbi:TPM domain-containing protein [Paraburkholderia aromaticivorans]|uniref:TPM domain-containing protein n=1 Tax=Paraburkholderia aromaticivorans TaxID=2026199 RepID=UPI0038B7A084
MNLIKAVLALVVGATVAIASNNGIAQVAVPALTARVTDLTATLTTDQTAALNQNLQTFESRKGTQIAVLMIPTTAPEAIEQYSLRVAEQWKLGRKKVDDGALLVIAKNDRAMRIEVGYGLEGALNDATSKRIISETISPRFKQGDFYGGITAGIDQIVRVADGEPLPAPSSSPGGNLSNFWGYAPVIFVLAIGLGGVLRAMLGRLPGAVVAGGAVALIAWFVAGGILATVMAGAAVFLLTLTSGGMAGYVGAYGLGAGGLGRGGRGSAGFGGGGGGFGGGGASGRW